ncbi:hypothetical protein [Kibdelosporangium philippinense]|uniref:hypothetical protein n=1 Tax=Kibdelosporangium philippinense TaxID=211113 RepID=UPI0035E7C3DB
MAEHLDGFDLADPVMITAAPCTAGPMATVQLSGESLCGLAAEILAWADTLDNVTASAWRPSIPDADQQVFLELRGRLTDDTPVKVFGGVFDGPGMPLTPGDRVGLSWGLLREWATPTVVVA